MKRILAALLFLTICIPAFGQSLMSGLVSHWKLDGPVLGLWPDSHGSNDLIPFFNPLVTPGVIGNAVQFDGTNSQGLRCDSNASMQAAGDFTFIGWLRIESTQDLFIVWSKGDEYKLIAEGGWPSGKWGLQFVIGDSWISAVDTDINLDPNIWYFVEASYDSTAGQMALRVDNSAEYLMDTAVAYGDPGITTGTDAFCVGSPAGNLWPARGSQDSLSLYNRLLTRTEATLLWNGGAGLDYPFE